MIKTLFFDLDHTLWDFEKNSRETLYELFCEVKLAEKLILFDDFLNVYNEINDILWNEYRYGRITKDNLRAVRFEKTLKQLGAYEKDTETFFTEEYINRSPLKKNLIPGTLETLQQLKSRGYNMHIITNGFSEVQHTKLSRTGLAPFFDAVVTSDEIGVNKPDVKIFQAALKRANARQRDSMMIGDHLMTDIIGARRAGLQQGYFNPTKKPHSEKITLEFSQMKALPELLLR